MAKKTMAGKNRAAKSMAGKNKAAPKKGQKHMSKNAAAKTPAAQEGAAKKPSRPMPPAPSPRNVSSVKASVKSRSLNVAAGKKPTKGVPGHEQDPKRRLGNFATMGEHARVGGRTSGIVGQTTKDFGTDNVRTKSTKPRTKHGKGSR